MAARHGGSKSIRVSDAPNSLSSTSAAGSPSVKRKNRNATAHLRTAKAVASATTSEAQQQQQQRKSADLVSDWKGSVGKFLFKGYDDEAAYFVRPLTESEIWLRDEADAWEQEMRLKIDKKREGQLRRELASRDMRVANNDHDVEAMKQRLLAAVVESTRSDREKQVHKERRQPEYQHRLAVAQQVAVDKADVFRQLHKERKLFSSSHKKMSRALDTLTAKLQGCHWLLPLCDMWTLDLLCVLILVLSKHRKAYFIGDGPTCVCRPAGRNSEVASECCREVSPGAGVEGENY